MITEISGKAGWLLRPPNETEDLMPLSNLCTTLIQQYQGAQIIDSRAAAGIVADKVLEAARTVPPPIKTTA